MRDRYADDGIEGQPYPKACSATAPLAWGSIECHPFRVMTTGVLPCSRSGAQLIGEVSRRDGGVCPIHRLAVNTDRVRVFHCSANRGRHPDATAADSELISPFCARIPCFHAD